ncbi:hypothetical protein [Streptomyces sp. NPDC058373]|uniref:hypothetical protein n=1 Tax=Streptomyces sp. NPDC058373 TaxID=3346465 RepID=UPI00364C49C3
MRRRSAAGEGHGRQRSAPVAALVATAALALTGCGGGERAEPDGAELSASAGTEEAGGGAVKRPAFRLPRGFSLELREWRSEDPREQAVLDDGREQVRAGYAAIGAADPDAAYFAFYNTRAALASGKEWVRSYTGKKVTVGGALPVYDAEVGFVGEGGRLASLVYCTDESAAYTENRETGKRVGNPEGTAPTVRYATTLRKSADGVWRTDDVRSERGAC